MNQLRDKLVDNYAEHYARVNATTDPRAVPAKHRAGLDLLVGPVVHRLPAGSQVLDLGCGTGILLHWLSSQPNLQAAGVDSSPTQVEALQRYLPNADVVCEDGLEHLRRHPRHFQAIFCFDVLEHIPGPILLEWVETAREALAPGGFFMCRTPNAASLLGSYTRYMDLTHERSFTSLSICQLLEAAGLRNCQIVPIRSPGVAGRLRQAAERALHRFVYRLCGMATESCFTYNVCALGQRSAD
jgi:2-polyprenyl-3-methyl-5-hydroxy-6-metoxy-1,4-benzoquinol methylase